MVEEIIDIYLRLKAVFMIKLQKSKHNIYTHLIPINRGILSTIYIKGNALLIQKTLLKYYENESFIQINDLGEMPKISDVIGSNLCRIGVLQHNKKSCYYYFSN